MKKSLSIIAASLISISTMAQAPAFPGAEGMVDLLLEVEAVKSIT